MTPHMSAQPAASGQAKGMSREKGRVLYQALKEAGVDFVAYLPDSWNYYLQKFVSEDKDITSVSVSREDEGIAIAMGAFLAGKSPALILEASGCGLCGLALAWLGIEQRMAVLIIASHTGVLGESQQDSHAVTQFVTEPLFRGMNIPCTTIADINEARQAFTEAMITVRNHSRTVAILLARRAVWED